MRPIAVIFFIIYIYMEIQNYNHHNRYEKFMETYDVEYSDSGVELGWNTTAEPCTAQYELDYCLELVGNDSLFTVFYDHFYREND